MSLRRSHRTGALLLVLALPPVAWSSPGQAAQPWTAWTAAPPDTAPRGTPTATFRALGTIEATLDGEPRVWHVVAGEAMDGPYASGVWIDLSESSVVASLGGLDSADPPIETFSRGGGSLSGMSMGDYDGSSLIVQVEIDPATVPTTVELPSDGAATVAFMPTIDLEDPSGMLSMTSGSIVVEEAALSNGTLRLRGTFSGSLQGMDGGGALEITDGRFDVEGIPNAEAIQPETGPDR